MLESFLAMVGECIFCLRDPLCYRPPKARSSEPAADEPHRERLLSPGANSANGSVADLDTEHQAAAVQLQQQPSPDAGPSSSAAADPPERRHSFHSSLSHVKRDNPFYRSQVKAGGEGVELKEAPPNLLLGQYHHHRQRQLVAPHPGSAVRRQPPASPPDELL
eukprot:scaffold29.g5913.t1